MRPSEKTNEIDALRERVEALETQIRTLAEMQSLQREHATMTAEAVKVIGVHVGLIRPAAADAGTSAPSGPLQ